MELEILKKVEQFNLRMIEENYEEQNRREKCLSLMIFLVRQSILEEKNTKDENGK